MAHTLGEVRAAHPPADPDDYERAYATSALALDLARLAYRMREQAGISQRELALRMHTTQSAIARLESGGVVPRLDLLARLSSATGVPLRLDTGTSSVDLGDTAHLVA
ncbi:XRE family transcriptional regulator [Actinobacteria bacterium YIM 96077]|uniref:Transcriptional regulator n=1 Tax=Phytoactinopolyspora halophila TaxID=1981511 RepID=A0A329R0V5_9ACTN|nr:helix-turn-helix transcriptional regulator [Phytoactinopolyspora halophila]AYY11513.1 XRE family transcriptional regulator [Actinobacteria bacterium YIM 96077]RAW18003.1 transcriptional regulator [Phytoactinopolyspora halophila]